LRTRPRRRPLFPYTTLFRSFKVVAAPGHERHQHVPAEGELAVVRARPVRQHRPGRHALALVDNRLLVDAGVLIRPAKFDELVNIDRKSTRLNSSHVSTSYAV